jgi:hypothetical protein
MIEATYIFLEIMTTCEDCSLFPIARTWNCPWAAISLGLLGKGGAMGVNKDVKVSFLGEPKGGNRPIQEVQR